MSRDDGFAVMDVSTSIHEDAKFKRLARSRPDLVAPAFLAYVALLGESWRCGERVAMADSWPAILPFDRAVVAALKRFELLDAEGLVASETWERWFGPARRRQEQARERWRRSNEKRHAAAMASLALDSADTARSPRGDTGVTAATVPTDPSVRPSDPSDLRVNGAPVVLDRPRAIGLVDPSRGRTA